ncbi:methyltransferase [Laceyella putida]|uniref:Methyltransferase n=1 Tax=Laceyella putida TaxID=110101 RepID=A0ABW2RQT2_9BACL
MESLTHRPKGPWVFDEEVARCFPDMLSRSIPGLYTMRELLAHLSEPFIQADSDVIDLGCSLGDTIQMWKRVSQKGVPVRYVGLDHSLAMAERAKERFADDPDVSIRYAHLPADYPSDLQPSVVAGVLTLQFLTVSDRIQLLQQVYDSLLEGGAFFLVEKVIASSAPLDQLFIDQYHHFKHRNGYSWDAIHAKAESLRHIMTPITLDWNRELLKQAGFRHVELFWKHLNFAGWIAIK